MAAPRFVTGQRVGASELNAISDAIDDIDTSSGATTEQANQIATNTTNINTNRVNIAAIIPDVEAAEADIDDLETDLTALTTRVTTLETGGSDDVEDPIIRWPTLDTQERFYTFLEFGNVDNPSPNLLSGETNLNYRYHPDSNERWEEAINNQIVIVRTPTHLRFGPPGSSDLHAIFYVEDYSPTNSRIFTRSGVTRTGPASLRGSADVPDTPFAFSVKRTGDSALAFELIDLDDLGEIAYVQRQRQMLDDRARTWPFIRAKSNASPNDLIKVVNSVSGSDNNKQITYADINGKIVEIDTTAYLEFAAKPTTAFDTIFILNGYTNLGQDQRFGQHSDVEFLRYPHSGTSAIQGSAKAGQTWRVWSDLEASGSDILFYAEQLRPTLAAREVASNAPSNVVVVGQTNRAASSGGLGNNGALAARQSVGTWSEYTTLQFNADLDAAARDNDWLSTNSVRQDFKLEHPGTYLVTVQALAAVNLGSSQNTNGNEVAEVEFDLNHYRLTTTNAQATECAAVQRVGLFPQGSVGTTGEVSLSAIVEREPFTVHNESTLTVRARWRRMRNVGSSNSASVLTAVVKIVKLT